MSLVENTTFETEKLIDFGHSCSTSRGHELKNQG